MTQTNSKQNEILHKGLLKLGAEGKGSKVAMPKVIKPVYHNQNFCVVCGNTTNGASGLCSFSCQNEFYGIN
jgi:hypothetical protein